MSTCGQFPGTKLSFKFMDGMTDKFSEELKFGEGPDKTTVYKVSLANEKLIVVKKHEPVDTDKVDFDASVKNAWYITEQEHPNIVKMTAFCIELRKNALVPDGPGQTRKDVVERIFCYDYIEKSLHYILFDETDIIEWKIRFKIIKGICKGLMYLHTLAPPIIHLNLKPKNIMLDTDMNPKIADFGYSRIVDPEHTRVDTGSSVGSVGYMAPEYFKGVGQIKEKAREISRRFDIYSLGLIILDITTGNQNFPGIDQSCARKFIDEVNDNYKDTSFMIAKYKGINEHDYGYQKECIKLALTCVDLRQDMRPKISDIVEIINLGNWS